GTGRDHGARARGQCGVLQPDHGAARERARRVRAGQAGRVRARRRRLQARFRDAHRRDRRRLGAARRADQAPGVCRVEGDAVSAAAQSGASGLAFRPISSMGSVILALRFLTIARVGGHEAEGPDALGRAAWWFPVVGLVIGALLAIADRGLALVCPAVLATTLVLTLWKAISGGLHLDGLADCLDGLAGHDVQRRLAIMRDPHVGAFGALGLICCLLVNVGAPLGLSTASRLRMLLLAPAVGRLAPLLVGPDASAPGRAHGMGARFMCARPRWAGPTHLVALLVLTAMLLGAVGPLM